MITLDQIQAVKVKTGQSVIETLAIEFGMPQEWIDKHSNSDWANETV